MTHINDRISQKVVVCLSLPGAIGRSLPEMEFLAFDKRNGKAVAKMKTGRVDKITHELKNYLILFFYLYVCFGAIILFEASMLMAHGVPYEPYGLAIIKALIMAKFMLIGNALRINEPLRSKSLIYSILWKSLVYLGLLAVLTVVEEVVSGALHGHSVVYSLSEIAEGGWLRILAMLILLWLILIPVVAVYQMRSVLGAPRFDEMLLKTPSLSGAAAWHQQDASS